MCFLNMGPSPAVIPYSVDETFRSLAVCLISYYEYYAVKSMPWARMLDRYILSSSKIRRPDFVKIISAAVLFKKNFPMRVPLEHHTCIPSPHPE